MKTLFASVLLGFGLSGSLSAAPTTGTSKYDVNWDIWCHGETIWFTGTIHDQYHFQTLPSGQTRYSWHSNFSNVHGRGELSGTEYVITENRSGNYTYDTVDFSSRSASRTKAISKGAASNFTIAYTSAQTCDANGCVYDYTYENNCY